MVVTEASQVKPTNKIVWDSKNLHVQTKHVEAGTSIFPGRLVKVGANDNDVIVATAASVVVGWAGYEQTMKKWRPATVDTTYVTDDQIAIINGPGIGIVGSLAIGATTVKGTPLTQAAAGELTGAAVATDFIVALAEEYKAESGSASQDIMVRSMI